MGHDLEPFRQGTLDHLCGFYAVINAMRWATRDDNIEDEFWDELFQSLVLTTEVQVGIADVLVGGIGARALHRVLGQVLADVSFRFGRTFELHRPFKRRQKISTRCLAEELTWILGEPNSGLMAVLNGRSRHWATLVDINDEALVTLDDRPHANGGSKSADISAVMARSCLQISRRR